MKLNLLPQTISKGKQTQSAVIFSILIALGGLFLGGYLSVSSQHSLDAAKAEQEASVTPAADAYKKSTDADTILAGEKSVALIRDATLARAMIKHNDVYPDLYEEIKPYIPSFYRINSLSAASGGDTATVTMVGTIDTYQQYADLMLFFSRYKPLVSISRSGFIDRREIVPSINTVDEEGRPRRQDQAPIPDDKLARLAYFQSNVQNTNYTGEGNFGSGTDNTRGAMPTASLVTVVLTIKKDLRVPEPRQTLTSGGGGAPAAGGAMIGGPMGGGPRGAGGGMAGGGATPPAEPPTGKAGKKGAKGDDSE
jgi:hypothetical protein